MVGVVAFPHMWEFVGMLELIVPACIFFFFKEIRLHTLIPTILGEDLSSVVPLAEMTADEYSLMTRCIGSFCVLCRLKRITWPRSETPDLSWLMGLWNIITFWKSMHAQFYSQIRRHWLWDPGVRLEEEPLSVVSVCASSVPSHPLGASSKFTLLHLAFLWIEWSKLDIFTLGPSCNWTFKPSKLMTQSNTGH